MSNISATVKVRLEIEVTIGNWSGGETFEGLRDLAIRESKQKVFNAFANAAGCRIIGEPKSINVSLEGEIKP
jgi:hypothetical protein